VIEQVMAGYTLFTPWTKSGDLSWGGPALIRTKGGDAVPVFATHALAMDFIRRSGMPDFVQVVEASALLGDKCVGTKESIEVAVLFRDGRVLDQYFSDPIGFPGEDFTVPLRSFARA